MTRVFKTVTVIACRSSDPTDGRGCPQTADASVVWHCLFRRIMLCAANIRYWLSAGRGGFALSPSECLRSSFYVMVYSTEPVSPTQHLEGFKVKCIPALHLTYAAYAACICRGSWFHMVTVFAILPSFAGSKSVIGLEVLGRHDLDWTQGRTSGSDCKAWPELKPGPPADLPPAPLLQSPVKSTAVLCR